jgi:transcriptional regulator with XRE-family HTH domain
VSKSVRTRAHHAVVDVLLTARLKAGLTQRQLARRLPKWLHWRYTTVAKMENRRRNLTFVEAREYAKAVGMTVAMVDRRAAKLAAGRHEAPVVRRPGKRVRLAG